MGNNPSNPSKPEGQGSNTPTQSSASAPESSSPRHSRRDTRNILHSTHHHRSAAPPEASLAQAHGSTTVVSRPKNIPGTAVSSLSGSPHSNISPGTGSRSAGGHSIGASLTSSAPKPAPPPPDEPSKPVDVPREPSSAQAGPHAHYNSDTAPATYSEQNLFPTDSVTDMYLTHPPRMPLPIEEEVHTPGSPILPPVDSDLPPLVELGGDSSDGLTRKSSGLSTGTPEDDEEDSEELPVDKARPLVPTKIVWKRGGDKVYVTGSIFQWSRKYRLHPVEGKHGYFSATVPVLPGTHHVRFLVDGIMQTSPDLPTTVDFGNNLVNYIEVSPDEVHKRRQHTPTSTSRPDSAEPGPDSRASRTSSVSKDEKAPKPPRVRTVPPPEAYRREIPDYLQDFDQSEESPTYQLAAAAIEKLPTPPSLPGFLSKPILNAAVLMKDDNSVLNMPNHTVLNHLATSSIKNGVLAVSATTRYKNKYVTTIIYKPTSADDG